MKLVFCLASLALVSCAATSPPSPVQDAPTLRDNRFSVYVGQRNLDEDDYDPVDQQLMLGLEYAYEAAGSAIGFEVGLMGSSDDDEIGGIDVEATTAELYAGVRKTFGTGPVRPYVGGGLSAINAEVDASGLGDEDDSSLAGYVHGGAAYAVSEAFLVGLDLRLLFGSDLDFSGFETDADYLQFALFAGFGF